MPFVPLRKIKRRQICAQGSKNTKFCQKLDPTTFKSVRDMGRGIFERPGLGRKAPSIAGIKPVKIL